MLKSEVQSPVHPRSGRISINLELLDQLKARVPQKYIYDGSAPRIEIRPFDDVSIVVDVFRSGIEEGDPERRFFSGFVVNPTPSTADEHYIGTFGFTEKKGKVSGSIVVGPLVYQILDLSGEGQIVRIFDTRKAQGGPPVRVPSGSSEKPSPQKSIDDRQPPQKNSATPTVVDVLIAYTQAAQTNIGADQINSNINEAIGTANHAYVESQVDLRIRLARSGRTQYEEPGHPKFQTEVNDLASANNPSLADVRRWRDQSAADLLNLWTNSPTEVACGAGRKPSTFAELTETFSYSAMSHTCYSGDVNALVHELGHNMGLDHDPAAETAEFPNHPLFPYGLGFVGLNAAPRFRTVMAYRTACEAPNPAIPCPMQLLFSNPNITRNGIVAGNATNANESLAINNVRNIIAGYRSPGPLKDIQIGATGSSPNQFVAGAPGTVYFVADDGIHGSELWKSDGSRSGTVMVKDIAPGSNSSNPTALFNFNGQIFFGRTNLSSNQGELWKSDGTEAGTVLVKALGIFDTPNRFVKVGNTLFFSAGLNLDMTSNIWRVNETATDAEVARSVGFGLAVPPRLLAGANGLLF
ncbi:MAG: M12 family metallo-peptidase [Burkholderiales bacterium]|nr:M12 family metallo-peptidase [Burkholderiales bacterium]